MKIIDRDSRRAQLLDLRVNDPLELVALYRRAIGLNHRCMLPGGMDFSHVIESILDHEVAVGRLLEPVL